MANTHRACESRAEYAPEDKDATVGVRRIRMTTRAPESGTSVPPDEILSTVANEQRRAVLRELDHTDGDMIAFDTLEDHVVAQVRADDGGRPDDHRERVPAALHHIHLPKLDACGMIVYDTETMQVRSATGELGKELLAVVESHDV